MTPGGFNVNDPFPPVFTKFLTRQGTHKNYTFLDSATANGRVSMFDALNGGTLFDTDLPQVSPSTTANLTWDFDAQPYSIRWVLVEGAAGLDNLYFAPMRFQNAGTASLTLNGTAIIGSIAVYGTTPTTRVPDLGSTFALMLCGLGACAGFGFKRA